MDNNPPTDIETPIVRYAIDAATNEDLHNRFSYHAPKADQLPRYESLRSQAFALAGEIVSKTPKSREQSLAITHLETAIFYANAAIARNE